MIETILLNSICQGDIAMLGSQISTPMVHGPVSVNVSQVDTSSDVNFTLQNLTLLMPPSSHLYKTLVYYDDLMQVQSELVSDAILDQPYYIFGPTLLFDYVKSGLSVLRNGIFREGSITQRLKYHLQYHYRVIFKGNVHMPTFSNPTSITSSVIGKFIRTSLTHTFNNLPESTRAMAYLSFRSACRFLGHLMYTPINPITYGLQVGLGIAFFQFVPLTWIFTPKSLRFIIPFFMGIVEQQLLDTYDPEGFFQPVYGFWELILTVATAKRRLFKVFKRRLIPLALHFILPHIKPESRIFIHATFNIFSYFILGNGFYASLISRCSKYASVSAFTATFLLYICYIQVIKLLNRPIVSFILGVMETYDNTINWKTAFTLQMNSLINKGYSFTSALNFSPAVYDSALIQSLPFPIPKVTFRTLVLMGHILYLVRACARAQTKSDLITDSVYVIYNMVKELNLPKERATSLIKYIKTFIKNYFQFQAQSFSTQDIFELLRKVPEGVNKLWNSDIGSFVRKLIIACSIFPFVSSSKYGELFANLTKFFKPPEYADFKKYGAFSFLMSIIHMAKEILYSGFLFAKGECSAEDFLSGGFSYKQWYQNYIYIKTFTSEKTHLKVSPAEESQYLITIDKFISDGNRLIIQCAEYGESKVNSIIKLVNEVREYKSIYLRGLATGKNRPTPLGVLIAGYPNAGKSRVLDIVRRAYGDANGIIGEAIDDTTYYRTSSDDFYTNMASTKRIMIIDDIGALREDTNNGDTTLNDLLQIISSLPFTPNMAKLEEKGSVIVAPGLVACTSNRENINARAWYNNAAAVLRRFKLVVEPIVNHKYRPLSKANTLVGANKNVEDGDTLILYTVKVPMLLSTTLNEVKYEYIWNKVDNSAIQNGFDKDYYGRLYTEAQLYKLFRDKIIEHETEQTEYLSKNNRIVHSPLCSQHDMPSTYCGCDLDSDSDVIPSNIPFNRNRGNIPDERNLTSYYFSQSCLNYHHKLINAKQLLMVGRCYDLDAEGVASKLTFVLNNLDKFLSRSYSDRDLFSELDEVIITTTPMKGYQEPLLPQASTFNLSIIEDVMQSLKRNIMRKHKVLGIFLGLTAFATAISVYSQSGNSTNNMDVILPEATNEAYVPPPVTVTAAFKTNHQYQHLHTKIRENLYKVYQGDKKICYMLGLKGHYYLTNKHIFSDLKEEGDAMNLTLEQVGLKSNLSQGCNVRVSVLDIFYGETDYCIVKIRNRPMVPDITTFFLSKESIKGDDFSHHTFSTTRQPHRIGTFSDETVTVHATKGSESIQLRGYLGNIPLETGDCGTVYMLRDPHKVGILGIHAAGNGNSCFCLPLFMEDINELFQQAIDTIQQRNPNIAIYNIYKDYVPVHKKSPVLHLRGYGRIVGDIPKIQNKQKGTVKQTDLKEILDKYWPDEPVTYYNGIMDKGYYNELGEKDINGVYVSPLTDPFQDVTKPKKAIDPTIADAIGKAFKNYVSNNKKLIQLRDRTSQCKPLTFHQAINGIPGEGFINRIPMNTSAGYPFYKPKNEFTRDLEEHEKDPNDPDAVRFQYRIEKEAHSRLADYKKGISRPPIYTATLKDEPLPKRKILRTRAFCSSQLDFLIIFRMYILPIISFIQKAGPELFCAVGVNCKKYDWTKFYKHFHNKKRMIAGDFRNFDKEMQAAILWLAWELIIFVGKFMGYTEEDIRVCRVIAADSIHCHVLFNTTLVLFNGFNPSGIPATVIVNNFVNLVYMMYCFFRCGYDLNEFHKVVKALFYGDDNVMSVLKAYPKFNHTNIQKILKEDLGITYTMADKTAESVPFISIDGVDFLKRRFIPYKDRVLAPIEPKSIYKSLAYSIKCSDSTTPTARNLDALNSALIESVANQLCKDGPYFDILVKIDSEYRKKVNATPNKESMHNAQAIVDNYY